MLTADKKKPLIVAGISVFRDAQPCLRSCLDSFCHWVDGCIVLHGAGAEDDPDTPDDGTMQIVEECAARFDPMNVKQAYYRKHPQRFILLEMMREVTDAQGRTVQLISRQMRMQTLLAKILPGNFLFYIKPSEVLIGDARGVFDILKTAPEEEGAFYVNVVHQDNGEDFEEWEPRIVRAGTSGIAFDENGELAVLPGCVGRALDKGIKLYHFRNPLLASR